MLIEPEVETEEATRETAVDSSVAGDEDVFEDALTEEQLLQVQSYLL